MASTTARPALQSDAVREHNRLAVLRRLREGGDWSRTGLARAVGTSVPTVATILRELRDAGLLEEAGLARPAGGRPARTVRLRADAAGVLAIDLSGPAVRSARFDLAGGSRACVDGPPLDAGADPGPGEALASHVPAALAELARAGVPVHGLAVAVPGVVDGDRVRLAPALGWHDEPLADRLRALTGLPVLLENDVNALAVAERPARASSGTVLLLAVAGGIGAGLVVDGRLHRGAHAAAGEVGYALMDRGARGGMDLGAPGPFEREVLPRLRACVQGGRLVSDASARPDFEEAVERLHRLLHTLVCALDPERVSIAWPADPEGRLATAIAERWEAPLRPAIEAADLGADAALRGVGALALDVLAGRLCADPAAFVGAAAAAPEGRSP